MNENFMKEEPVLPLITRHGAAYGHQHDGQFAI